MQTDSAIIRSKKNSHSSRTFIKRFNNSKQLLILFLPCLLYLLIFRYAPIYGVLMAFKDYQLFKGFSASPWVGLKYFEIFFSNPDSYIIIRNTFLLGLYSLLWGFTPPLIFALILNEVRSKRFKGFVQTVSYIPHFISTVVLAGMVISVLSPRTGIINNIIVSLGGQPINFLAEPGWFRTIYIASGIWQELGWASIIYIAALSGIDTSMYESSVLDGANKLQQVIYITIPALAPTIITLLILNTGWVLSVGFEKVFLLYNPAVYETADVIETYVYRIGIHQGQFSYATAIGLSMSVASLFFIYGSNFISRKFSDTKLW